MVAKPSTATDELSVEDTDAPGAKRPSSLPPASLIICSRNRPQMLAETVESVLQGDQVPAEFVIIDQSDAPHPTLSARAMERDCEIRYIWSRTVGLSRARNLGVEHARHDIVAFIDDDMFVPADWFSSLIHSLVSNGSDAIVTGRVLPAASEGTEQGYAPALLVSEHRAVYRGRDRNTVLAGGHMATYRSTLLKVGGFDVLLGAGAPFPSADDMDLGFRLLEAGCQIIYDPDVVLYHRAWREAGDFLRVRWNYGIGRGAFYAKHLSIHDRFVLRRMLFDISIHFIGLPRKLVHDRVRGYGDATLVIGILFGGVKWLVMQRST